jgi:hypothetical protein
MTRVEATLIRFARRRPVDPRAARAESDTKNRWRGMTRTLLVLTDDEDGAAVAWMDAA